MLELRLEDSSPCQVLLWGSQVAQEDAAQGAETWPGRGDLGPCQRSPSTLLPSPSLAGPGQVPCPSLLKPESVNHRLLIGPSRYNVARMEGNTGTGESRAGPDPARVGRLPGSGDY